MIAYQTGDITESGAEALVNTVNCVGVMGRGVALQFKKIFPENFKAYHAACERKEVQPGGMFVFETNMLHPRYIINFPTKRHWRGKSRMEDIESGLESLVHEVKARGIRSIAIPPLGSGMGGLHWPEVHHRIVKALEPLDGVEVHVYEPRKGSESRRKATNRSVPGMTSGRAVLVMLMDRYVCALLDPFVTLLEVHKLMYFMQAAGEPLKLEYAQGPYGPYAENLRHVLDRIEGHFVSGYDDGKDSPGKPLELVPGAVEDAQKFLTPYQNTKDRFGRVVDLVSGFETPSGLELLATVHWVTDKHKPSSAKEVMETVYAWGTQKKQFTERQIHIALDALEGKGWIEPVTR